MKMRLFMSNMLLAVLVIDSVLVTNLIRVSSGVPIEKVHGILYIDNFVKYSGNPILEGGDFWCPYGIRDPSLLLDPSGHLVKEDEKYVIYFNGRNITGGSVTKAGRATSEDGINWTKYEGNPVFADPTNYVMVGSVIKRGENDYVMYYANDFEKSLAMALSTDGLSWTRYDTEKPNDAILTISDFVSCSAVCLPYVTKIDDVWYMVFEGATPGYSFNIFMADSTDGYNWSPSNDGNPIYTGEGLWHGQANPSLYKIADGKYVIFCNVETTGNWAIGVIHSTDLTSGWTNWKNNPILKLGESGQWDDTRIEGARICMDDIGKKTLGIWYFGLPTTDSFRDGKIGYATCEDPTYSAPVLLDPYPQDGATYVDLNPTLSITAVSYRGELMNITFSTNTTGSWLDIGSYINVGDGTYTKTTTTLDSYNTKYWWRVSATNCTSWTNKTYSFTTQPANYAPTLSNPLCIPTRGRNCTEFCFNVMWSDLDGGTPATGYLKVYISTSGWSTNQSMIYVSGDHKTGALYSYSTTLPKTGRYSFTFYASDGMDTASLGPVLLPNGLTYPTVQLVELWHKYENNPILSDPSGLAAFDSVLKVDAMYHMYYTYRIAGVLVIGHATSDDGKNWIKDETNNPVLARSLSDWDSSGVVLPIVWVEGGTWYMLYRGDGPTWGHATGLATSSDGIHWTKSASNPVLTGESGKWDYLEAEPCGLIKVESTYYLWYGRVPQERKYGLATSSNLINWVKDTNNPIFTDQRYDPAVFKYQDYYYILVPHRTHDDDYSEIELYRDAKPTFYPGERQYLGVVYTSPDEYSPSEWDNLDHDTPFVLTDNIYRNSFSATNNQLWMYFAGQSKTGVADKYKTGLTIETDIAKALGLKPCVRTQVCVYPTTSQAILNNDYVVYINVTSVTDLYAWEFQLNYSNTILDLTSVSIVSGGLNEPTQIFHNLNDESNGHLWWAVSTTYPTTTGISYAKHAIFEIHFHTLAAGTADLHLYGTILSDSAGSPITHTVSDGTMDIGELDLTVTNINIHDKGCSIYEDDLDKNGADYYYPVNVTINNAGTEAAGAFHVKLEIFYGAVLESSGEIAVSDLAAGASKVINFTDVFHPLEHGTTYKLTATVDSHNEVVEDDETNNTLDKAIAKVTIIGDINGDQTVNIFDAVTVGLAWNAVPLDPYWNIRADINHDGKVDVLDGARIAIRWRESW